MDPSRPLFSPKLRERTQCIARCWIRSSSLFSASERSLHVAIGATLIAAPSYSLDALSGWENSCIPLESLSRRKKREKKCKGHLVSGKLLHVLTRRQMLPAIEKSGQQSMNRMRGALFTLLKKKEASLVKSVRGGIEGRAHCYGSL
jgi:hypothetical protein